MKQNKYQEALNYLDWHCSVEHKEQQDILQELVYKETDRIKNEYENAWHNIKIQEHLEKIAKNSEQVAFDTLGSKRYKTNLDAVREYLLEECETAINEVIGSWIDWSDEE